MIENNDLLVPKLMSIKRLNINSDINLFETFVEKTENSLKCLDFWKIDLNEEMFTIVYNFKKYTKICELRIVFKFYA